MVKKKKDNRPLTINQLKRDGGFVGMTPGQCAVIRFCQDVLDGQTPAKGDMQILAEALQPIEYAHTRDTADIMNDVAKNLGLIKKQGKKASSEKYHFIEAAKVAQFLLDKEKLIEKGKSEKDAEKSARESFMAKHNIGDRAARDKIKKHNESAKIMLPILRYP